MALQFPLSAAAFLDLLPVQSVRFHAVGQLSATGLAGGDVITAEVAAPMWQGVYTLAPMRPRVAAAFEVLIEALQRPGATFYAHKANQIGPAADPRGVALAGRMVRIAALDFVGSRLSLNGLPAGFRLQPGDHLSFNYGAAPAARGLHRIQEAATANGSGVTGLVSVGPYIEPGAQAGAVVSLVRASCKAIVLPGSVDFGTTAGNMTVGVMFGFRQTFR